MRQERFLEEEKRAVIRVLQGCVGRERAKPLAQIAAEAGIGDRRLVEALIELSLAELPWPLVSGDKGMWIPQEEADLTRYYASLRSRIFKMFRRLRVLQRKAALAGFARQGMCFRRVREELFG